MNYQSPMLTFLIVLSATQTQAGPIVAGYERFHDDDADKDSLGALLMGELNCLSCHRNSENRASGVSTKQAPLLMEVKGRVKLDYLRQFIADPTGTKPGTTMPNLFHGQTAGQTSAQVEAILHFLNSLGREPLKDDAALVGGRRRGEVLYNQVGCRACHDAQGPDAKTIPTSVPHPDLEAKYTLNSLADFIKNPLHARPAGRMPSLNLSQREAQDIAAFLLPNVPERAGAAYTLYRGNWNRLPKFDELKPTDFGTSEKITANVGGEANNFALRWEARFAVEAEGNYMIHLGSDDGSRLYVDGQQVIDNDGVHGVQFKSKDLRLKAGVHDLQVDFFEAQGGEELYLFIEGPGLERTSLDTLLVGSSDDLSTPERLAIDVDLVTKGRKIFYSVGCANCHSVTESITAPVRSIATDTSHWRINEGCLSPNLDRGIPDFKLTQEQRDTLNRFFTETRNVESPSARIHSTLLTFNCYACHARDEVGGIEEDRNIAFQTTQSEMGDEGRIPPTLDLVGAKITAEWLDGILTEGAKDRPYMLTRMPKFGSANVGHLRTSFGKDDSLPPLPEVDLEPAEAKRAAWRMIGNRGFGCIQCHTFGPYKATGVQSIDMTLMTKRLKEVWFRRYVRNPSAFRKGTRMPSAWQKDESILKDLLGGSSDKQIAAVWTYLKDGRRAKTPLGLVTNSMELIAIDEPIIYRNFIAGAGSRAIGVGYPEGANLAFDANNMSIALIWQGAFIDAKRHWTGRGAGFEPPKGEKILSFGEEVSFAVLRPGHPWPMESGRKLGHRFLGYRLGEGRRPTFLYSVASSRIEDTPVIHETATAVLLVRTITIDRGDTSNLFYKAATSDSIQDVGDGWYELGNDLKISLNSSQNVRPIVRDSSGRSELLLPIKDDSVTITQEYAW